MVKGNMNCSVVLYLFVLGAVAAEISLKDILSIDPKEILKAPSVSDAEKRRLIDCLDSPDTTVECPDIPVPSALKKLRNLIEEASKASENKGLIGGLLSGVSSVIGGGSDGITSVLTEASKNAKVLIDLFKGVKSIFEKQNAGLPEDPFQDISEYLRQKHAHETKYDLIGATKTRGQLRAIYANTNDDILHKYSSNYNALNPHVQLIGVVRMLLEIYS